MKRRVCEFESAWEKSLFLRQTLDFAKGAVATVKFSPLFLNLLNHPFTRPPLFPNRHNARFVFPWCYRIRYSDDLATVNFVAHVKRIILWKWFLQVSPMERERGTRFQLPVSFWTWLKHDTSMIVFLRKLGVYSARFSFYKPCSSLAFSFFQTSFLLSCSTTMLAYRDTQHYIFLSQNRPFKVSRDILFPKCKFCLNIVGRGTTWISPAR